MKSVISFLLVFFKVCGSSVASCDLEFRQLQCSVTTVNCPANCKEPFSSYCGQDIHLDGRICVGNTGEEVTVYENFEGSFCTTSFQNDLVAEKSCSTNERSFSLNMKCSTNGNVQNEITEVVCPSGCHGSTSPIGDGSYHINSSICSAAAIESGAINATGGQIFVHRFSNTSYLSESNQHNTSNMFSVYNCICDARRTWEPLRKLKEISDKLSKFSFSANRDSFCKLGLKSGFIPDSAITASSNHPGHLPRHARLDYMVAPGAWAALEPSTEGWIQVSLDNSTIITGVITQGRYNVDQYVTKYSITFLGSDGHWRNATNSDGLQVFSGNRDGYTKVTNYFQEPVEAIKIRLYTLEWFGFPSLRLEYLTC